MQKSEYFPQHFKRTRPYIGEAFKALEALKKEGRRTPQPKTFGIAADAYVAKLKEVSGAPGPSATRMFSEIPAALTYCEWVMKGAILYDIEPELAVALEHSDPGDIALSDLQYPFQEMYFSFGDNHSVALANGAKVTGAYILYAPGISLRIVLTAPLDPSVAWWDRQVELFDVRIPAEFMSLPLNEALDRALEKDFKEFLLAAEQKKQTIVGHTEELELLAQATERLKANQPAYRQAAKLIVNGICFVTAYPEDIEERWQDGAPEHWVAKANAGTPKEAEKARSRLKGNNFLRIHRIGPKFAQQSQHTSRAAHWRKGHWRNQAHGPQMQLRKLLWIRPVAVLGGGRPEEEPRVYEVSEPKQS